MAGNGANDPFGEDEGLLDVLEMLVPALLGGGKPADLETILCEEGVLDGLIDVAVFLDPEMRRRFAFWFARAILSAAPLPAGGAPPAFLPKPGRRAPCPCGSGDRFARCCAPLARTMQQMVPHLREPLWIALMPLLPQEQVREALQRGRLDPEVLVAGALRVGEVHNKPRKAAALAETALDVLGLGDERAEDALEVLWNMYDALGWRGRKKDLLRKAAAAGAPNVRAAAHHRLATIAADQGRFEVAWEHWEQARRIDPEHTGLGLLEVTLLVSQKRLDEAADRARYWLRRLERDGSLNDGLRAFYETVARDPGGMRLVALDQDDPLRRLDVLLREAAARPRAWPRLVPPGPPEEGEATTGEDDEEELRAALKAMGIELPEGFDLAALETEGSEDLEEELEELEKELAPEEARLLAAHYPDGDPPPERVLVEPGSVADRARGWREVFPAHKPFGTGREPFGGVDAIWEPRQAKRWLAYLERHPEALDSLDVLDDLALAVESHPVGATLGVPESVYDTVLERGAEAVEHALREHEGPARLPWGWHENRPALRLLMRLAERRSAQGRQEEARGLYQRLLALDPLDSLGVRLVLINEHLRQGDDAEALALAGRYGDDVMVETRFGEALALWRLGRHDDAKAALAAAHRDSNRHVIPMLCARRRHRPRELDEAFGISLGGKGQAWLYCEAMADVWRATPGILDAAREVARSASRAR